MNWSWPGCAVWTVLTLLPDLSFIGTYFLLHPLSKALTLDVGTGMKPCTLLCNVHRSVSGDAVVFGAATKSPGTVSGAP